MFGQWNATIQTPYLQLNTVFTIAKDGSSGVRISVESDPIHLHLIFEDIRVEGEAVYATGKNVSGQPFELGIIFLEKRFSGALTLPDLGAIRFEGTKGRGVS